MTVVKAPKFSHITPDCVFVRHEKGTYDTIR